MFYLAEREGELIQVWGDLNKQIRGVGILGDAQLIGRVGEWGRVLDR